MKTGVSMNNEEAEKIDGNKDEGIEKDGRRCINGSPKEKGEPDMANKRKDIKKVKLMLRLKGEMGMSTNQIGSSLNVSARTVSEYLKRAKLAKIEWNEAQKMSEAELREKLFPNVCEKKSGRSMPDMGYIHKELKRKWVTRRVLWEEYRSEFPDGVGYSRFCELYKEWKKNLCISMRQDYRAGEKMFVDYASQKVQITCPCTGEVRGASIFIAVLGASNYTYFEASLREDEEAWVEGHIHALEYFGGAAKIFVPDQTRVAVNTPCRYEPEINLTYERLAEHYGAVIIPARPRKPKDKAKVEAGVLIVERWVLARLRNHTFFSIAELNETLKELREKFNCEERLQGLESSRKEIFERIEKNALLPLPVDRFEFALWKKAKVNIDYHVEVEKHYYSVPYNLRGEIVDVRYNRKVVEIYHKGIRITCHVRSFERGKHTTVPQHMPEGHRAHLEWTPTRLIEWGRKTGERTGEFVEKLLATRRHPEQGYRSALGIMRLTRHYEPERMERACAIALTHGKCSYNQVKNILEKGIDKIASLGQVEQLPEVKMPIHENIRGAEYYINNNIDIFNGGENDYKSNDR